MKLDELLKLLKRLFREYVKFYLKNIFIALILSIIVAGSTASIAWLLDPAVKKIFIDQDKTLAWLIPITIILAFSAKGISLYFARINIIHVGQNISGKLQKQIANNVLTSDIQTLEGKHSGKYISHVMYDAGQVQHLVSTGVLNLMKDSFSLVALMTVMFYQNWKLSLFALIMMPLSATLARTLGKRIGKATGEAGEISGKLTTFLSEILKGSKMIRIYQKEIIENENANNVINELVNKNIKIASVIIRATPIMEILTGIMIAGFIYFSGKLISAGELEVNNFFSFLAAMMLAYQPIRSLATINMVAYQGAAAAKRIFKVIDETIEIKNDNNLPDISIKNSSIKFEGVSFKYKISKDKAIKNINLDIEGGSMTAFVGHSGAGKSTIINLLPRFYDPQNGNIFIDNQNIKSINLNSLRKNLSLVSQDVILFDDTIKANIAYANKDASDEDVVSACKFAAAHEFIKKLPNSYDTLIGENGVRLSGGQKQRISIARAILKRSPIILLDEATSSLDSESEEIVQNAIINLTKNKTTLVIAHRLSTIHKANKIYVLKEGLIIGSGNHDNLIKNSSEYKSLYEKQLK
ncbi:ABC transporter ATP-binding protein/permease [Pelagibacteraceae bacterium]|jgi:ATP-binding cassette, subfamily B, bacterial MsbA|nr:ABC transporter ATP-binding protein/permease [Pelagibacteraceae bacterium]|tara:strand:+ start:2385 stop:4127 length:1743 start_codon:yes stop_codon:yes gene_type:complete